MKVKKIDDLNERDKIMMKKLIKVELTLNKGGKTNLTMKGKQKKRNG